MEINQWERVMVFGKTFIQVTQKMVKFSIFDDLKLM